MPILRASALGSCTKAQAALLLGFTALDAPEKIQQAYERGNTHETDCAQALRDTGHVIYDEQDEVVLTFGDWTITGHLDGIIEPDIEQWAQSRVWEAKAPNAWAKFEKAYKTGDWTDPLTHRYAWQISVYMLATELEAYVTCWGEDHGVRGFVIEVPPFGLEQVEARVQEIASIVESGMLPQLCSQRDYPCPVVYLHEDADEAVDDPGLDLLVEKYGMFARREKEAAEQKKVVQAEIRAHVTSDDTLTTRGSKVTVYQQAAATRYDYDAMRRDGIDLDAYAIVGKTSERVKITRSDNV